MQNVIWGMRKPKRKDLTIFFPFRFQNVNLQNTHKTKWKWNKIKFSGLRTKSSNLTNKVLLKRKESPAIWQVALKLVGGGWVVINFGSGLGLGWLLRTELALPSARSLELQASRVSLSQEQTIICFLSRWGKVAILQFLHKAPPGLVIYLVKRWTRSLSDCATNPLSHCGRADPYILVIDIKLQGAFRRRHFLLTLLNSCVTSWGFGKGRVG